jgi:hypothetical protein
MMVSMLDKVCSICMCICWEEASAPGRLGPSLLNTKNIRSLNKNYDSIHKVKLETLAY